MELLERDALSSSMVLSAWCFHSVDPLPTRLVLGISNTTAKMRGIATRLLRQFRDIAELNGADVIGR